jgi:hypothetical protein
LIRHLALSLAGTRSGQVPNTRGESEACVGGHPIQVLYKLQKALCLTLLVIAAILPRPSLLYNNWPLRLKSLEGKRRQTRTTLRNPMRRLGREKRSENTPPSETLIECGQHGIGEVRKAEAVKRKCMIMVMDLRRSHTRRQ